MGVTIHFEGKLKNIKAYNLLVEKAKHYASIVSSETIDLDAPKKHLKRTKNDKDWDYIGKVKGIQIQPHPDSDPLILEFDKNLYIQEFCKTQFAGLKTHISIISFLKEIEVYFDFIEIFDEGEYYQSNDKKLLEKRFQEFFIEFERLKKDDSKYSGPYRINGRIIDLIENQHS